MFHNRLLTPWWQEIRFREWMSEDAIREFERMKGLNSPMRLFEKGVGFARHALRIERMTRSTAEKPRCVSWITAADGASSS